MKICLQSTLIALAVFTVAPIISCVAQETTKTMQPLTPTAQEIVAKLKPGHPRLLIETDWATFKKRVEADPQLSEWRRALRKEADEILTQEPSKYEIPDGKRLLATSRRVWLRTRTLAMVYRLEGDPKYLQRTWAELETAAQFKDWNPSHFLDTAEMTHAFAIGYDWLFDVWTPEQRAVLRAAMLDKGLKVALAAYRGENKLGWWAKATHNWNQVVNGGIGSGALALLDEEPQICGEILSYAIKYLPLAMHEFGPDGAWNEGPGYWSYATSYNISFLAALNTALGTDFNLSTIPGFDQTGLFPVYLTSPIGKSFNYADSGDGAPAGPQSFWLARRFNQPLAARHALKYEKANAYSLLWYQPLDATTPLPALDKLFRSSEVVTMRSSWNEANALFVGFKSGDNKANHSHLDLGTFVLDALGERWILNNKGDNYNLPKYFGDLRWTYYRLRAEGHNTLVLNPNGEPDQDPKAAAKITHFESSDARSFAITDLTAAYKKNATKVQRGLQLFDRATAPKVLLQDEIKTPTPTDLWWFVHTSAQISLDETGTVATLSIKDKKMTAKVLSPARAKFTVMEAAPLPSSPQPPKQGDNTGMRKLAIHLEGASDERIAVVFSPGAQSTSMALKPLNEWK